MFKNIKITRCAIALLGSAILAFGLYNIHSVSNVTEGGALGLTLLLEHWLNISPALSGFVFNLLFYIIGFKALGRDFLTYSAVCALGFSITYKICEQFEPVWPQIADYPLIASVLGAIFVGVGVGLCVRIGGAPTGDDALAMSLSRMLKIKIEWVYLLGDILVLGLSLSYIPISKIVFSLISVILSGQLVGLVERIGKGKKAGS